MAVKIRLMRIGSKHRPFYRVVAIDERKKRTGAYLELLGTYNPLTEPKEIILKKERIEYWKKQGAQSSVGFLRILGQAPRKAIRPPKKQQPAKPEPSAPKTEEAPAQAAEKITKENIEQTPLEETTAEQIETTPQENEEMVKN